MAHDDDPPTAGQAAHQLGPKLLPDLISPLHLTLSNIPSIVKSLEVASEETLSVQFLAFHLPGIYFLALLNALHFIKV